MLASLKPADDVQEKRILEHNPILFFSETGTEPSGFLSARTVPRLNAFSVVRKIDIMATVREGAPEALEPTECCEKNRYNGNRKRRGARDIRANRD
jgi:hypothetical protein